MVILICIILLTSENEHIYVSLISMSILVNCLFKPFAHFSIGLSAILVWMVGVLLFWSMYELFVKYTNFKYLLPLNFLPFHSDLS